jgi:hypothetical protein
MRAFILTAVMMVLAFTIHAQEPTRPAGEVDLEGKKLKLIGDLKALEAEGAKLDGPIARAYSKVAVADSAWYLDKVWSEKLLREAYDLTLPDENERARLRNQPPGTNPAEPAPATGSTARVRNWVMRVASRDKPFFDQMTKYAKEQLGRAQQVATSAALALGPAMAGDVQTASKYVLDAADADPTQIFTLGSIHAIAIKDRAAADALTMAYIDRLRSLQLSGTALSRVYGFLGEAILPDPYYMKAAGVEIPPAGPEAIRAYISFVLESGTGLLQQSPDSVANLYLGLRWAWQAVQQYAPDLAAPYLQLESLARAAGGRFIMPSTTSPPASPEGYVEARGKALDSRSRSDIILAISAAMFAGEFKEARRLLDLLPAGDDRDQQAEELNYREAMSQIKSGEDYEAEQLARKLTTASHIWSVYAGLVKGSIKKQDHLWAGSLSREALKRLKQKADKSDVPRMIAQFATMIAPTDDVLALDLLGELVDSANHAGIDTSVGYPGFDVSVFTIMMPKYGYRMRDEANNLKDRLQRVAVLGALYHWEADQIRKAGDITKPPKSAEAKLY